MSTLGLDFHGNGDSPFLRLSNSEYDTERFVLLEFLIDNKLISKMPQGIEIRSESRELLRVRGRGRASLRMKFNNMQMFENACPREDGSIEVAYIKTGKILIVPLRGALWHNAMWLTAPAKTDDFYIDLIPSVETLEFEAAVHAYYSNGVRQESYALFDV